MAAPLRFQALTELLCNLPAEVPALRVPFRDMETLIGGPLPRGAWTHAYWRCGTVARNNWLRYGFAASLDRRHETVLFTRLAGSAEERPELPGRPFRQAS